MLLIILLSVTATHSEITKKSRSMRLQPNNMSFASTNDVFSSLPSSLLHFRLQALVPIGEPFSDCKGSATFTVLVESSECDRTIFGHESRCQVALLILLVYVSCSSATLAIRRITQMHPPEFCRPEAALARPLEEFPFGLQPQILQVYIPYGPNLAQYPEFESLRILTQLKQERRKIFSRCPVNAILAENVCLHAAPPRLYSWWLVSTCIDTSRALVLPKMRILLDLWQVTCYLSQDRYTPKRPFKAET